jgi:hypothetical protein
MEILALLCVSGVLIFAFTVAGLLLFRAEILAVEPSREQPE